jgi:hypothetical protein
MPKSSAFETNLLLLYFNAVGIAGIARDALTPATTLTVALHTADPGEDGNMSSSEAAYVGYTRITVARTGAGWVVAGNSVSPVASIDFPECTATPGAAIAFFSVGTGVANDMAYSGTVTPNIAMAVGVIPRLKTATTITEE